MHRLADTTLIVGLAGIGGTVIAATLGPWTQRQIEHAKRRAEQRQSAEVVLRAVRMIDLELGTAQHWLIRAVAKRRWFRQGWAPRFDAWNQFAADIAGALDPNSWRQLVHAHTELQRVETMYQSLLDAAPDRDPVELPFDDRVAADLTSVTKVIQEARILVRPINLGGSTFRADMGFWFPETPELGPWNLEDQGGRWRRVRQRMKRPPAIEGSTEPDDPAGTYVPMPYGVIWVADEDADAEPSRDARNASAQAEEPGATSPE